MFERARTAGLPMLGGVDFYVTSSGRQLRAHYWAAQQPALDQDDQQGPSALLPVAQASSDAATIVILPGFTEFCEKYSQHMLRLHQSPHPEHPDNQRNHRNEQPAESAPNVPKAPAPASR